MAATGAIAYYTNQVAYVPQVDVLLEAAAAEPVGHVVLLAHDGKVNALHNGVRYWAVQDTDEAIFSLLTLMASKVVVPNKSTSRNG